METEKIMRDVYGDVIRVMIPDDKFQPPRFRGRVILLEVYMEDECAEALCTPAVAREIAASLIALADSIEPNNARRGGPE